MEQIVSGPMAGKTVLVTSGSRGSVPPTEYKHDHHRPQVSDATLIEAAGKP